MTPLLKQTNNNQNKNAQKTNKKNKQIIKNTLTSTFDLIRFVIFDSVSNTFYPLSLQFLPHDFHSAPCRAPDRSPSLPWPHVRECVEAELGGGIRHNEGNDITMKERRPYGNVFTFSHFH